MRATKANYEQKAVQIDGKKVFVARPTDNRKDRERKKKERKKTERKKKGEREGERAR